MAGGRPPKEKSFANMLNIALAVKEADGQTTKLRRIAETLVEKAIEGEGWAIKEVADRTDGKPFQQLAISSDEENGGIQIVLKQFNMGDDK